MLNEFNTETIQELYVTDAMVESDFGKSSKLERIACLYLELDTNPFR